MSTKLSLQDVINRVKKDLMLELDTTDNPLFIVGNVEIEMAVKITTEGKGGVNIHVLEIGGTAAHEQANTIKVTLTPILSHDEIRGLLSSDVESSLKLRRSARSLIKGDSGMVGEPE